MQEYLNIMDKELLSQERRSLLATTIAAREVYLSTFDDLVNTIFDRNKIITGTLNRIGPEIAKDIEDVKLSIKATQDDIGPKLVASNKQSITFILLISSIAVLLGLGLAFLITCAVPNRSCASLKIYPAGPNRWLPLPVRFHPPVNPWPKVHRNRRHP